MQVIHIKTGDLKTVEKETAKMYFFTDGKKALKTSCRENTNPLPISKIYKIVDFPIDKTVFAFNSINSPNAVSIKHFTNSIGPEKSENTDGYFFEKKAEPFKIQWEPVIKRIIKRCENENLKASGFVDFDKEGKVSINIEINS